MPYVEIAWRNPGLLQHLREDLLELEIYPFPGLLSASGRNIPAFEQPRDRVILREAILFSGISIALRIADVVAELPVHSTFDKRWALARAGPHERLLDGPVYGLNVGAIDRLGMHVVGGAATRDRAGGQRLRIGHLGDSVVLADENCRRLPDRREIHRLMKRARVCGAVSEERDCAAA